MRDVSSSTLSLLRGFAILLLITAIGMPIVTLSQESTATTSPESASAAGDVLASSTPTLSATSSEPVFDPEDAVLAEGAPGAPAEEPETGGVPEEASAEDEEADSEEELFDLAAASLMEASAPSLPPLSVREFKKRVVQDSRAFHSCEAEVFRIDVSGQSSARARILLARDTDTPYEVEIGALPLGIDVTFSKSNGYRHMQGAHENFLDLAITNQEGSQKGNFSIPIMYTEKGKRDSVAVCQMNLVNL